LSSKFSETISMIFNAPMTCGYSLIIYFALNPAKATIFSILGVIIFLYIMPWIPVFLYWLTTNRSPSRLSGRKRIPFIIIGLISYISGAIYFSMLSAEEYIFLIALHMTYAIFSILLVIGNIKSKPSVHVGGYVAPFLLLALSVNIIFLGLLIITPVIGWSRIKLGIHTLNQLIQGFIIGAISSILALYLTFVVFF